MKVVDKVYGHCEAIYYYFTQNKVRNRIKPATLAQRVAHPLVFGEVIGSNLSLIPSHN